MLPPCGRDDSRYATATEEEKLAQVVEVRDGHGNRGEQAPGGTQLPAVGAGAHAGAGAGLASALADAQQNGAAAAATYRCRVRLVHDVGVLAALALAVLIALRCST